MLYFNNWKTKLTRELIDILQDKNEAINLVESQIDLLHKLYANDLSPSEAIQELINLKK